MSRYLYLLLVLPLLGLTSGCSVGCAGGGQSLSLGQVLSEPDKYSGKTITVDAFYYHAFEVEALAGGLDLSNGRASTVGETVWVAGGVGKEVYDRLYQDPVAGPIVRFGKVRVTGRFESGGKFGQMGAYSSQITPEKVELLSWTPE